MASSYILPDLHCKIQKADDIIQKFIKPEDKIIQLGDIYDRYNDTAADAEKVSHWLNKTIKRPNTIFLFGNHDVPYVWDRHPRLLCPGYTLPKSKAINKIINKRTWEKYFNLVHFEQGWICSHAGFHPKFITHPIHGLTQEYIAKQCDEALIAAAATLWHPLWTYGSRMGERGPGGCTWLDWGDFVPIPGINQILGHSSCVGGSYSEGGIFAGRFLEVPEVKWMDKDFSIHECSLEDFVAWDEAISININCDTGLKCILKIDSDPKLGKITLIKV